MAVLSRNYTKFNKMIELGNSKKESLEKSRDAIKTKIRNWFNENKPNELQPKFHSQGSFQMNTIINPIPVDDDEGNKLLKYDLDYGVYFIEKEGEDNKRAIETWHDWVYKSVENHTNTPPIKKTTCVRVIFSTGRHIDLPIYYKEDDIPELAHKSKRWIDSDPREFYEWFNNQANRKLKRIVRYLKAWKNYQETTYSHLKFPSGFALTILATENRVLEDNDDEAFRKTIKAIKAKLDANKFKCLRPTTPKGENVFAEFSETRKNDFLKKLDDLITACDKAGEEKNFKTASEYLIEQLGDRFPLGKDENEEDKNSRLSSVLGGTTVKPKPYAE